MKQTFFFFLVCLLACSCRPNNESHKEIIDKKNDIVISNPNTAQTQKKHTDLPFIGKRMFVTRPGVSGTGTPQYYIEILDNKDVFFSFGQHDMSSNSEITERYYAGKFNPYLKSFFVKLDNEVRYYHVNKDTIYEVNDDHTN